MVRLRAVFFNNMQLVEELRTANGFAAFFSFSLKLKPEAGKDFF